MAVLTTALIQAFMPGASPPDVNTAIFFMGERYKKKEAVSSNLDSLFC
jgi:hypothetical protein